MAFLYKNVNEHDDEFIVETDDTGKKFIMISQPSKIHDLSKVENVEIIEFVNCHRKKMQRMLKTAPVSIKSITIEGVMVPDIITEIDGIERFKELESIRIVNTYLKKVPRIKDNIMLESLTIVNCEIEKFVGIRNKNLKNIFLDKNKIHKISISGIEELETLSISDNKIFDMTNIRNLPSLKRLDLSKNMIRYTGSFEGMQSLENIDLRDNNINKMDISMLKNLKILSLNENPIRKIDGIDDKKASISMDFQGVW